MTDVHFELSERERDLIEIFLLDGARGAFESSMGEGGGYMRFGAPLCASLYDLVSKRIGELALKYQAALSGAAATPHENPEP